MELLNKEEIEVIVKESTNNTSKVLKWTLTNYADHTIGYLGEHLKLCVETEKNNIQEELLYFVKCMPRFDKWKAKYLEEHLKLCVETEKNNIQEELLYFVKCMPRLDKWKAKYLEESTFFSKEYAMLSTLFTQYNLGEGSKKWCPKLIYSKKDLFVFEDMAVLGYKMPQEKTLGYEEMLATVEAVAKFHAQSYAYEDRKSKELGRSYTIWEDYSEHLKEPDAGAAWRSAGRNAVIDYSIVYSKYKKVPNFKQKLQTAITKIYEEVYTLMKPNPTYRNVVAHRDIWFNNILIKTLDNGKVHAILVDFQTVLYCSAMLDLSSILYLNTTRHFRDKYTGEFLDYYYEVLKEELKLEGIHISTVYEDKSVMQKLYDENILFGITQAGIIVPIVSMKTEQREELFCRPENSERTNTVTRSPEFIAIASEDEDYETRVTELFDEIIERYVL